MAGSTWWISSSAFCPSNGSRKRHARGGRLGIPTARRLAVDGRNVLDGNLPAPRLGAFDFHLGGFARLLVDLLIGSGFVLDVKLSRRVRFEEQNLGFGRDAMIDLVQDRAAK